MISVILPVYNAEKFIGQAINSIISQTYQDWELHICDDASTDKSWDIIQKYRDVDCRLKIYQNESNLGKVITANRLLKYCNGKYLTVHDADDWSEPRRFEEQIKFLDDNCEIAMCGCDYYSHNGKIKIAHNTSNNYEYIKASLPEYSQFHGPTIVIKSKIISDIGGLYRHFTWGEDIDLCCRIVEKFKATNISIPLYNYRIHETSITNNPQYLTLDRLINKELRLFLFNQRKINGKDCLMLGNNEELETERRRLLNKFQCDPSLIYWEHSQRLYYLGFRRSAIFTSFKGFLKQPGLRNFKNILKMFFSK